MTEQELINLARKLADIMREKTDKAIRLGYRRGAVKVLYVAFEDGSGYVSFSPSLAKGKAVEWWFYQPRTEKRFKFVEETVKEHSEEFMVLYKKWGEREHSDKKILKDE